jgi:hypothetical protein
MKNRPFKGPAVEITDSGVYLRFNNRNIKHTKPLKYAMREACIDDKGVLMVGDFDYFDQIVGIELLGFKIVDKRGKLKKIQAEERRSQKLVRQSKLEAK